MILDIFITNLGPKIGLSIKALFKYCILKSYIYRSRFSLLRLLKPKHSEITIQITALHSIRFERESNANLVKIIIIDPPKEETFNKYVYI